MGRLAPGHRTHAGVPGSLGSERVLRSNCAPGLSQSEIDAALADPVDSRPLAELGRGAKTACIAVDDLARPTRAAEILPHSLSQLQEGGILSENITIVMATGTHGRPGQTQIAWKVGADVARRYRVEVHDATAELAGTGITYGKEELRLNRSFLEADVKLGVGCVMSPFIRRLQRGGQVDAARIGRRFRYGEKS